MCNTSHCLFFLSKFHLLVYLRVYYHPFSHSNTSKLFLKLLKLFSKLLNDFTVNTKMCCSHRQHYSVFSSVHTHPFKNAGNSVTSLIRNDLLTAAPPGVVFVNTEGYTRSVLLLMFSFLCQMCFRPRDIVLHVFKLNYTQRGVKCQNVMIGPELISYVSAFWPCACSYR